MRETYLLQSKNAQKLYRNYAKELPIIDFHNHLSIADIKADRRFEDLTEMWISCDPYKHRLMRICGIAEHFITGDADPYDKLEKYCEIFPLLAGNPVYDWSRMEMSSVFGIECEINKANAKRIYDQTKEMLASGEFSHNGILSRFNIEYQSPVASLFDDLSLFDNNSVAPSLRGDNLLSPTSEVKETLKQRTGIEISGTDSYISAVSVMLDKFAAVGCRFADHALDEDFFATDTDGKREELLVRLGEEYAKRGWTLLLHMGAKRRPSDRLATLAGTAGGYASVGSGFEVARLCGLLNKMESWGRLPDTVLFPLNMNDQASMAIMQGSFSEDGTPSKVQLGPAWWWCDNAMGIRNTLSCISSFGVLSQFIGMTTDSRSVLSFVRHDYFRRLLCSWLDEMNETEEWEMSEDTQGALVEKICCKNARDKIIKG